MKEEQWRAAWELFQASVDVPREQVEAFLDRATISPEVRTWRANAGNERDTADGDKLQAVAPRH